MTAYEPSSDGRDADLPRPARSDDHNDVSSESRPELHSESQVDAQDAARSQPWSAGAQGPQVSPPFWHDQTGHVEAPVYYGDQPDIQPASSPGFGDTGSQGLGDTASQGFGDTGSQGLGDTASSGFGAQDPWATGPVSPTSYPASAGYPQSPSPWSGADASGTSSSTPPYQSTIPYGSPAGPPYAPAGTAVNAGNAGKPKRMRSALIGTAVAAALIGGATGAGTVAFENHHSTTTASSSVVSNTGSTAPTSALTNGTVAAAAKKITPSVVTIQVTGSSESGTGSGVVVRSDGYILTNDHVVSVAGTGGSITVQTSDGRSAKASIVGTDSTDDLAVIKVTGLTNLTAATFAKSSALTVGQSVVAVGAPLDLPDTVTSGIVSATARTVRSGDNDQAVFAAVQTDAAINPGNSGGPLVDLNGNVIGINAAIASTSSSGVTVPGQPTTQSGSIGIGFAIPSDEASRIANELITTGKATHAALGVEVDSSTSTTSTGATLRAVTARGAAASAGLAAGDVVTKVDGEQISDGDDLIAAIRAHAVKDKVTITYVRAGATHTAKVTLTSATS